MRFTDAGAGGLIDDVAVLRIAVEARSRLLGAPPGAGLIRHAPAPFDIFSSLETGIQLRIIQHHVRFRRRLFYRDLPVLVELCVARIAPVAFRIGFRIHGSLTDQDYATGMTEIILARNGRAIRLPQKFKADLQRLAAVDPRGTD